MLFQSFNKHELVVSLVPGAGPGLWAQLRIKTSPCMWEKYPSSTWESLGYVRRIITASLTYFFPRLSLPLPHPFSCTSCSCCLLILIKAQNYPFSRKSSQTALSNHVPLPQLSCQPLGTQFPFFLFVCTCQFFGVFPLFWRATQGFQALCKEMEDSSPEPQPVSLRKPQAVFGLATRELKRTCR